MSEFLRHVNPKFPNEGNIQDFVVSHDLLQMTATEARAIVLNMPMKVGDRETLLRLTGRHFVDFKKENALRPPRGQGSDHPIAAGLTQFAYTMTNLNDALEIGSSFEHIGGRFHTDVKYDARDSVRFYNRQRMPVEGSFCGLGGENCYRSSDRLVGIMTHFSQESAAKMMDSHNATVMDLWRYLPYEPLRLFCADVFNGTFHTSQTFPCDFYHVSVQNGKLYMDFNGSSHGYSESMDDYYAWATNTTFHAEHVYCREILHSYGPLVHIRVTRVDHSGMIPSRPLKPPAGMVPVPLFTLILARAKHALNSFRAIKKMRKLMSQFAKNGAVMYIPEKLYSECLHFVTDRPDHQVEQSHMRAFFHSISTEVKIGDVKLQEEFRGNFEAMHLALTNMFLIGMAKRLRATKEIGHAVNTFLRSEEMSFGDACAQWWSKLPHKIWNSIFGPGWKDTAKDVFGMKPEQFIFLMSLTSSYSFGEIDSAYVDTDDNLPYVIRAKQPLLWSPRRRGYCFDDVMRKVANGFPRLGKDPTVADIRAKLGGKFHIHGINKPDGRKKLPISIVQAGSNLHAELATDNYNVCDHYVLYKKFNQPEPEIHNDFQLPYEEYDLWRNEVHNNANVLKTSAILSLCDAIYDFPSYINFCAAPMNDKSAWGDRDVLHNFILANVEVPGLSPYNVTKDNTLARVEGLNAFCHECVNRFSDRFAIVDVGNFLDNDELVSNHTTLIQLWKRRGRFMLKLQRFSQFVERLKDFAVLDDLAVLKLPGTKPGEVFVTDMLAQGYYDHYTLHPTSADVTGTLPVYYTTFGGEVPEVPIRIGKGTHFSGLRDHFQTSRHHADNIERIKVNDGLAWTSAISYAGHRVHRYLKNDRMIADVHYATMERDPDYLQGCSFNAPFIFSEFVPSESEDEEEPEEVVEEELPRPKPSAPPADGVEDEPDETTLPITALRAAIMDVASRVQAIAEEEETTSEEEANENPLNIDAAMAALKERAAVAAGPVGAYANNIVVNKPAPETYITEKAAVEYDEEDQPDIAPPEPKRNERHSKSEHDCYYGPVINILEPVDPRDAVPPYNASFLGVNTFKPVHVAGELAGQPLRCARCARVGTHKRSSPDLTKQEAIHPHDSRAKSLYDGKTGKSPILVAKRDCILTPKCFKGRAISSDGINLNATIEPHEDLLFTRANIDLGRMADVSHQKQRIRRELFSLKEEKFKEIHSAARLAIDAISVDKRVELHVLEGVPGSAKTARAVNLLREELHAVVVPTGELKNEYADKYKMKAMTHAVAIAEVTNDMVILVDEAFKMDPFLLACFAAASKKVYIIGDREQLIPDPDKVSKAPYPSVGDWFEACTGSLHRRDPFAKGAWEVEYGDLLDTENLVAAHCPDWKTHYSKNIPKVISYLPPEVSVKNYQTMRTSYAVPIDICQAMNKLGHEISTTSRVLNSIKVHLKKPPKGQKVICFSSTVEENHSKLSAQYVTVAKSQGSRSEVIHLYLDTASGTLSRNVKGMLYVAATRATRVLNVYESSVGAAKRLGIEPQRLKGHRSRSVSARGDAQTVLGDVSFDSAVWKTGEKLRLHKGDESSDSIKRTNSRLDNIGKFVKFGSFGTKPLVIENYASMTINRSYARMFSTTAFAPRLNRPPVHEIVDNTKLDMFPGAGLALANRAFDCLAPTSAMMFESRRDHSFVHFPSINDGILRIKAFNDFFPDKIRHSNVLRSKPTGKIATNANRSQAIHTAIARYGNKFKDLKKGAAAIKQGEELYSGVMKFIDESKIEPISQELLALCTAHTDGNAAAKRENQDIGLIASEYRAREKISSFEKTQQKASTDPDGWLKTKINDKGESEFKAGQGISAQPKSVNHICAPWVLATEIQFRKALKHNVLLGYGYNRLDFGRRVKKILARRLGDQFEVKCCDISQQDTSKGEWTDHFMRRLYQTFGVPDQIIDHLEKINVKWVLNADDFKLSVKNKFQSGRADTLFANTAMNMGLIGFYMKINDLHIALFQGDDSYIRAGSITRAKPFRQLKVQDGIIGDFVGYVIGQTEIHLDIPRMASKILNRTFPDNQTVEDYVLAVRDWLQIYTSRRQKQESIILNAAKYGIPRSHVAGMFSLMEDFCSKRIIDKVAGHRVQRNSNFVRTAIFQKKLGDPNKYQFLQQ